VLNTKSFKNDYIFSALCNAVNTSASKALKGYLQKEELEGDLGKSLGTKVKVKVKQCHYRPGQAQRVPRR
jgi:thermostable 8-oxoguanine DNA glycosylase